MKGQRKALPAAGPAFTPADRLKPVLCPMCSKNEAGFMGGSCEACSRALVRGSGA